MKNKKWNFLVYPHAVLLLWALLFFGSLFLHDGGKTAGTLAVGNILFLFVNIPFAVFSLVLKVKGQFGRGYGIAITILSILNIVASVAVWIFAILVALG